MQTVVQRNRNQSPRLPRHGNHTQAESTFARDDAVFFVTLVNYLHYQLKQCLSIFFFKIDYESVSFEKWFLDARKRTRLAIVGITSENAIVIVCHVTKCYMIRGYFEPCSGGFHPSIAEKKGDSPRDEVLVWRI